MRYRAPSNPITNGHVDLWPVPQPVRTIIVFVRKKPRKALPLPLEERVAGTVSCAGIQNVRVQASPLLAHFVRSGAPA